MVVSPKMLSSDRLLIARPDARKRSVARAQLVPLGEVALTRPVQARVAARELRRVGPRGCAARRAWNARAMALGAPLSTRLAIAGISHGSPHERWQTGPFFGASSSRSFSINFELSVACLVP